MDLETLEQRILNSDKSDAEKAQCFLDSKVAQQRTLSVWQMLVDDIPDAILHATAELLQSQGIPYSSYLQRKLQQTSQSI